MEDQNMNMEDGEKKEETPAGDAMPTEGEEKKEDEAAAM